MSKYIFLVIISLLQIQTFSQGTVNIKGVSTVSTVNSNVATNIESNEYLIIFKSPCLIQELKENMYLKAASITQPIKSEHDRFVSDLSALRKSNSTGLKSASTPIIKYELFRTINAAIIESNEEEIAKIKALGYVKAILKNEKIQLIKEPISENRLKSASNVTIGTNTENGEGVKVGIIDSGIDYKNPALGGGFGSGFKVAGGYDFENNDSDPMDDDGHGTSVAGVIAANGELIGIAPKATLYAYKVMNAWGSGWSNNVITALEHCVDPNRDLDFSDHLDIINMSIAAYYMSEQELKTFSDIFKMMANLKIIICIGAGNEGPNYLLINNMSVSENVLCIGSYNSNNEISTFSSRGFGINNYGIKPDIVALGENVKLITLMNSTVQNGGTSIACPGVAGVATLLKQKHKDWTYNQIKSALMNSADDLGFNVMEQGAGKVNLNAALNQTTIAFPQTINWGTASENNGIVKKTYTLKIFNKSQIQQKYNLDFGKALPLGVDLKTDESSLVVNSNDSISVTLNLTLDQSQLKYPDQIPYNYYGRIKVNGTTDNISIPWTLLRGCNIKFNSDIKFATYNRPIIKILKNGQKINPSDFFNISKDVVVPPGKYDVLFSAFEGELNYPYTDTLKAYLYIKENIDISGSVKFDFTKAEIKNRISIQSVDEKGKQLSEKRPLINNAVINNDHTFTDFVAIKSKLDLSTPIIRAMYQDEYYINDFKSSENYQFYAGDYRMLDAEKKFIIVNFEVPNEISDNIILKNPPTSLNSYHFIFNPIPNQKCYYGVQAGQPDLGCSGPNLELKNPTFCTLWIDKKNDGLMGMFAMPDMTIQDNLGVFSDVSSFGFIYSYGDSIQIKSLRSIYREEFQTVNKNDTVFVNNGPVYYSLNISSRYNYKYFDCYSYLKGMYGERLDYGFSNSSISIFDPNEKVLYQNKIGKYNDDPYTGSLVGAKIEMSTSDYFINGKNGKALLRYEMETTPPALFTSIQSLQFLNNSNQIRSVFKIGSQAKLRLILNGAETTSSIRLYFKFANETEWKSRSFSKNRNQFIENILETDISDLLLSPNEIDFKIEVEDRYKFKMSYTLEPAISVTEKKLYNNLNIQNKTSNLYIYPNPAKEFIAMRNAAGIKKIVVSDLNGRILINKTLTYGSPDIVLDISFLGSGVYILTTTGEKGIFSEKILKL